jgi:Tfp pilus assembly protein PilV
MTQGFNEQSGFTLIETTLYIALFVLVMVSVILATYNMIASTDKAQYRSLIHNEAQFSIRKFNWLLNDASSYTVNGSILNITTPSGNHTFALVGSKLQADGVDLNGDIAPVSNLTFTPNAGTVNKPAEIEISFRMNNAYYDETFTAKKFIR